MTAYFPLDEADAHQLLELALYRAGSAAHRPKDFAQIESLVGSAQQERQHRAASRAEEQPRY
jgi:hypothetical protein